MREDKIIQIREVEGSLSEGELLSNDESKISKENIPLDENGMPVFNNTIG